MSGMSPECTVTNAAAFAAFAAFADIGVHQDGLAHVPQFADKFVKDPHKVVKAGDMVKVRVVEVDIPRKRIGTTMRKDGSEPALRSAAPVKSRDMKFSLSPRPQQNKAEQQGCFRRGAARGNEEQVRAGVSRSFFACLALPATAFLLRKSLKTRPLGRKRKVP